MKKKLQIPLHKTIEAQVKLTPSAIAVLHGDDSMTYGELNNRANQLAHYLHSVGVGGIRIGLCMEHGFDLMAAVLGILKAGGVCIPLEPTYPAARLELLMIDAHPLLTLTQHSLRERLPAISHSVCIDNEAAEIARQPTRNLDFPVSGDDPALIFHTSGTTGSPKGVIHQHSQLSASYGHHFEEYYGITAQDCGILKTTCNLVGFQGEVLSMLTSGARTVIANAALRHDLDYLVDLIIRHGVTLIRLTPSMLRVLLDLPKISQCRSLRHVVCSGEPLPQDLETHYFSCLGATLHVVYGATEAPGAAYRICQPHDRYPEYRIGRPISISRICILSSDLQAVSQGEPGEICIGGSIVAQGYLNDPELTAQRFIQNPLSADPEDRLYRTGDQGHILADGQIVYLGRTDMQANLRGIRIDLNEIEAALRSHPQISATVALVREDRPGDQRLVAYFTIPSGAMPPSVSALREFLAEKLPDSMVPSAFVFLATFPIGAAGKVDRQALPAPSRERNHLDTVYVPPRSALEQRLAAIWQDILGLETPPGIHDRFLDLGGTSLLATRLVQALESALQCRLPLAVLQQLSTIAPLAEALAATTDANQEPSWVKPTLATASPLDDAVYRAFMAFQVSRLNLRLAQDSLLMRLNPDASGIPLYCCGAYAGLAPALAHRPMIGMDSGFGVMAATAPLVEALAEHYVQEILAHRLPGPFVLLGHSRGAWVALEMAQRLLARGHPVPLVGLIDQPVEQHYPGRVAHFIASRGSFAHHCHSPEWLQANAEYFPAGMSVDVLPGDHTSIIDQGASASLLAERIEARLAQLTAPMLPLPAEARSPQWQVPDPLEWTMNATVSIPVTLINGSPCPWNADHALAVGYHWYDEPGDLVRWAADAIPVPLPVEPGQSVDITCPVASPGMPGRYRLVFDLLDRADTWGTLSGMATATVAAEIVATGLDPSMEADHLEAARRAWESSHTFDTIRCCEWVLAANGRTPLPVFHQLTLALQRWGRLAAALDTGCRGLNDYPDAPELHGLCGELALSLAQPDRAMHHVRRVIDLGHPQPRHWAMLGQVFAQQGNDAEAIIAYQNALAKQSDLDWHQNLAISLERTHQWEAAVAQWYLVINLRPAWAPYPQLVHALRQVGRLSEALMVIESAIIQMGANPGLFHAKAEILLELGHIDEAIADYREGMALYPQFIPNYLELTGVFLKRHAFELAMSIIDEGLRYNPDDPDLLACRAQALDSTSSKISDTMETNQFGEKQLGSNELLGHFDAIHECCATGWAIDKTTPEKPVSVQILAEGQVIAEEQTGYPRADINSLQIGFRIPLPAKYFRGRDIEIQARIAGSDAILPGGPHRLKLESQFSHFIDGFIERHKISGWFKDHANPNSRFSIQLLDDDEIIAAIYNDGFIDESGDTGRFTFLIPDNLLDGAVHQLTFRVRELDWNIETRNYLMPLPTSPEDDLLYPFLDDSIWNNTLAAIQARKARANTRFIKTDVEKQIELIEKSLNKNPEEDTARRYDLICQIGYLLKQDNQSKDALAQFSQAIALNNKDPKAYGAYADILLANGQEIEAETCLREALKHLPEESELLSRLDRILSPRQIKSAQIIAFYLPQFHPIPENDQWWGKGFTEWTNVTAATPLFDGHLQPRRPTALGYYDLRLPESANAQFELARRYGIDAFCYYYYWFEGKRILDRPLQDLVDGKTGPFPFCICWANEDWTRSWDGQSGEVLLAQNHSPESDFRFIRDVAPLLCHPDYVRFNGKPVLLIYRPDKLAKPRKTAKVWREWCRKEGIGDLHLCAVQSFNFDDPRPLGFDAAVEFPPHSMWKKYPELDWYKHLTNLPQAVANITGHVFEYSVFSNGFMRRYREPYILHQSCMLAWDNTARKGKAAHIYHKFSVKQYQEWLAITTGRAMREYSKALVFINAWNEWAEGTVLEPDAYFGYSALEATKKAKKMAEYSVDQTFWKAKWPDLYFSRLNKYQHVLMVGHDAFAAGAQKNLLSMAYCLKRYFEIDVTFILLKGGELLPEYEKLSTTYVVDKLPGGQQDLENILFDLANRGIEGAICSSVATGNIFELIRKCGFRVINLVHELPNVIHENGLDAACWRSAGCSNHLVFASDVVAKEFVERYWPDPEKILIAPQGIVFNPYVNKKPSLRKEIRQELNFIKKSKIVLGCGFGDLRKGLDLFIQVAGELCKHQTEPEEFAFIWVGEVHGWLETSIKSDILRLGLERQIYITGQTDNPARYFIAADVFALTSREDPFPSVVMEAFDAGLPVVAFDGGGGYVDIVNDQTGALVPYLDVSAMSAALAALLKDHSRRQRISEHVHQFCRKNFGYPAYLGKLLALLEGVPAKAVSKGILKRQAWYEDTLRPSITVIVPNYNYGRYLQLRLHTILDQTLPPDEIIILDDASTDYSLDIIQAIVAQSAIPIKVITHPVNTGNPFVQWVKGLEQSKCDLVWIAEADDYCEPTLLETLAKEFVDDHVVMAWTDSIMVDGMGESQGFEYKNYYAKDHGAFWHTHFTMNGKELIDRCLLAVNVIPNASAVLFRRKAVDSDLSLIQQYRFSGDWWFWISLAEKGKVSYRAEALNYHRRHAQSVIGDVLREGELLIPETLSFYQRLAQHKPELLSSKTRIQIFQQLEGMYRLFPKLQSEARRLKEHPVFQAQYQALVKQIDPVAALDVAQNKTAATLVLFQDVFDDPGTTRLIHYLQNKHDLHVVLLAEVEAAKMLINAADLDKDTIRFLPMSTKDTLVNKKQDKKKLTAKSQKMNQTAMLSECLAHSDHVITHGLAANVLIEKLRVKDRGDWTLIAGKEFDALLGVLPDGKKVTLEGLTRAISRCTKALFVNDAPSHPFGRIALVCRRPVDHLDLSKVHDKPAKKPRNNRENLLSIGVAASKSPEQWAEEIIRIEQKRETEKVDARLRILIMGDEAAQIRPVVQGKKFVELVWIYEKPSNDRYAR